MENKQFEEFKEVVKDKLIELDRRPKVEYTYKTSNDGKYLIHETRIVDIKPLTYINKVLENAGKSSEPRTTEERIN